MNSKFFNYSKKIIALSVIMLLCTTSVASAYSFTTNKKASKFFDFGSIYSGFFKKKTYTLNDLGIDLEEMQKSGNIDMEKIPELINKLPAGEDKNILNAIFELFSKTDTTIDLSELLNKLIEAVKSLLGSSGSSGLPVEATSISMNANTAVKFAGEDYAAKLHANVYMHVDENGNADSDKWAFLIHPFMLKGKTIASKIGPYYYEKGYNIIAPDLRSFGDSEGKVALGFLESLDAYDWLCKLNNEYTTSQVIVHGISLGAATTNFLSGIDGFMANASDKVGDLKSLRELNVIALVEDCGYTNMTEFAKESRLINMGIGLTEDNFEYYSDATNSLKYCDLPMLIIHGTKDTTVKPENATTIKNTVKGETEQWIVEGAPHAFIIIGSKKDEYKQHVQSFIDKYQDNSATTDQPIKQPEAEKPAEEETNTQKSESFLNKLVNAFKKIRK